MKFITLVNAMVANRVNYNFDAISWANQSYDEKQRAYAEAKKMDAVPLDKIYSKVGSGVCRQTSALVKVVGEILVEQDIVPVRGVAIGEMEGEGHAWSIFYLNPRGVQGETIIVFTDITNRKPNKDVAGFIDDFTPYAGNDVASLIKNNTNTFGNHPEKLFSEDEQIAIFEELILQPGNLGGDTDMADTLQWQYARKANRAFLNLQIQEQRDAKREGPLPPEDARERKQEVLKTEELLRKALDKSLYVDTLGFGEPSEYEDIIRNLFELYANEGRFQDAEALIHTLAESHVEFKYYRQLVIQLGEEGYLENAQELKDMLAGSEIDPKEINEIAKRLSLE